MYLYALNSHKLFVMLNRILFALLIVGASSCQTTKKADVSTSDISVPITNANINKYIIGTWKIASVEDLFIPDTSLRGIEEELIKKMVSTSKIEIREDQTYTDNSFEGVENGKWDLDEKNYFYKRRESGDVDTLKFNDIQPALIKGVFGTAEGATAKFTIQRVK
jgi:hypothetical protein